VTLIRASFVFLAALNLIIAIWVFPGEISKHGENWLTAINYQSNDTPKDISDLWLLGAFFIVTTITSVGFGDILPKNSKEMMLVMAFQVCKKILQILNIIVFGNNNYCCYSKSNLLYTEGKHRETNESKRS